MIFWVSVLVVLIIIFIAINLFKQSDEKSSAPNEEIESDVAKNKPKNKNLIAAAAVIIVVITIICVAVSGGNKTKINGVWYADDDTAGYIELEFNKDSMFEGQYRHKSSLLAPVRTVGGENRDGTPITTTTTTTTTAEAYNVSGTWELIDETKTLIINNSKDNYTYYWTEESEDLSSGCWNLTDGVLTIGSKTYHR